MLQVSEIRENKQQFIEGLAKRGFDGTQVLEEILQLDEQRRSSQAQLDEMLAQSNRYSREIGELYKKGQADEANALKEKTTQLKEDSKALNSKMTEISEQ